MNGNAVNDCARLMSITRGFGGDTAEYEASVGKITVTVGWALLQGYETSVFVCGELVREFKANNGYKRYVQPHEALSLMGYEVAGLVDFCGSSFPTNTLGKL